MKDYDLTRRGFLGASLASGAVFLTPGLVASMAAAQDKTALVFAQSGDPLPNAVMQANNFNQLYERLVFDNLTVFDEEHQPQPRLATAWEMSADLTEMTLHLRTDAKFHSGRPMTAADVIYSLEQAALPDNLSQMRALAAVIASAEAVDDATVRLKLSEPTGRLFELFELTPIVDKETFADIKGGQKVVGTGAFVWKSYQPGNAIMLEANPGHWGGAPTVNSIQVLIIRDAQALIAALRSNRADAIFGLTHLDVATIGPNVKRVDSGGRETYIVGLDASSAPFNDLAARQAVAKAIDRERINKQVFRGAGTATSLWWTEGTPGWSEELSNHWKYDPETAKAEIEKLGLAGTRLPVTVNGADLVNKAVFDIVRNNLEAIGFVVEPQIIDGAEFNSRNSSLSLGTCFLHKTGFGSLSAVACATATLHLKPDGGTHFNSPEFQSLIAEASLATAEAQVEANGKLGTYLVEQAFNLPNVAVRPPIVTSPTLPDLETTNAFQYIMPTSFKET